MKTAKNSKLKLLKHHPTERDIHSQVRQLLVLLKNKGEVLEFFHPHYRHRSQKGYPDWTIIGKDSQVFWVELKSYYGRLSNEQKSWCGALGKNYNLARSLDEFTDVLRKYFIRI